MRSHEGEGDETGPVPHAYGVEEDFTENAAEMTHDGHLDTDGFQGYLDRSLALEERERAEEHLESCARCRSEMEGWKLLFGELSEVRDLAPSVGFSDRVIQALPEGTRRGRIPILSAAASRLRGWLGAGARTAAAVHEHLTPELVQDFLDGVLAREKTDEVELHLRTCRRCREDVDDWRNLIVLLGEVPRFEPAPYFAEKVLAHVRIHSAVTLARPSARERAKTWFELNPRLRLRIAALAGAMVPPIVLLGMAAGSALSHPLVSLDSVAGFLSLKGDLAGAWLGSRATDMAGAGFVAEVLSLPSTLAASPILLGAAIGGFIALSLGAIWVLYRNLVSPRKDGPYVPSL